MLAVVAALRLASTSDRAWADRAIHGSVGAGGTLIATGAQGDRFRLDLTVDLKPRSRYGVVVGWRAFDEDHRGLITAGVAYEGAAARPRLVLDLHADLGVDLDQPAPVAGGGVRATLTLVGTLGLVVDTGAYVVMPSVDELRLQLQSSTLLAARW